ncbi:MAG: hypothetical protein RLZZ358_1128 [Bacteroidota bacterium]|jgi:hypothetical protein
MKRARILATFSLLLIFHLNGLAQEAKFEMKLMGGYLNQIKPPNNFSTPFQNGGFLGIGLFNESKLGGANFEIHLNHLSKRPEGPIINYYEGFSLKGQANYLVKIFPIGESHLFLGPGVAIHQPLKSNGDYNGPSFGANGKIMAPLKISGVVFNLTYDLDYLTGPGFWRNSVGISFRL